MCLDDNKNAPRINVTGFLYNKYSCHDMIGLDHLQYAINGCDT